MSSCARVLLRRDGGERSAARRASSPSRVYALDRSRRCSASASSTSSRCCRSRRSGACVRGRRSRSSSMLAFNWFFLPPRTRSSSPTRRTGSRSPSTSSRRSASARSPTGATARAEAERSAASERCASVREREELRRATPLRRPRSVSHDLRSPLTAILDRRARCFERARRRRLAERRASCSPSIRAAGAAARPARRATCSTSRALEAGAARPPRRELWTGRRPRRARARRDRADERARVDVVAPATSCPAVRVDAAQLERALVNLLENALALLVAGRPRRGARRGEDGEVVDPRRRPRARHRRATSASAIFEPFGRGAATATRLGARARDRARLRRAERRPALGRVRAGRGATFVARAARGRAPAKVPA